jgi:hypothetical protein
VALLSSCRAGLALALLQAAPFGSAPAAAEPAAAAAEEIKAAFVCNFADFIEWPTVDDQEPETVTIGILGEDPFGHLIDEAAKARSIPERQLEVARLENRDQATGVEILFVGASEEENLDAIFAKLRGHHVLTVGDLPGFAAAGGVIGLLIEDKRVRLEINIAASQRAGLTISSRLLKLARLVEDAVPPAAVPAPEPPPQVPLPPAELGGRT